MSTPFTDEHRQDSRFDVHIRVDYASRNMFLSNYVTNLSNGGLFIQTDNPLPVQSEILVTLTLPKTHTVIRAKGRVAWTYDIKKGTGRIIPGMGIKLMDLSIENKSVIKNYIQGLSPAAGVFSHG
jgi:type IV pilus assembly protein PilZ